MGKTTKRKAPRELGEPLEGANDRTLSRLPQKLSQAILDAGTSPREISRIYLQENRLRCWMKDGTPYGMCWKDEMRKELIVDVRESAVVEMILEMHSNGQGFGDICKNLEQAGVESRGLIWYRATVKRIIKRHSQTKEVSGAKP